VNSMSSDELRDVVESLFMCDAVNFNPIGYTNRDICEAYWRVKDSLNWRRWNYNLNYRYI
jgi:hypothetical protein